MGTDVVKAQVDGQRGGLESRLQCPLLVAMPCGIGNLTYSVATIERNDSLPVPYLMAVKSNESSRMAVTGRL